jgi:hypothetical protein
MRSATPAMLRPITIGGGGVATSTLRSYD